MLDKLGLVRVPQKVIDLNTYVREKYGAATPRPARASHH